MPLVSKSFSDIITFTRASTATYFDSAGVLQSAAIDVPRFDYNPATLAAQGLLIEEQRTNSIANNTMVGTVAGTPGTAPTGWLTYGSLNGLTQEIVGTGTENGITYIDLRYSGTPTTNLSGISFAAFSSNTTIAALSGQTWTGSIYVKIIGGAATNITGLTCSLEERSAAGGFLINTNSSAITATSGNLSTNKIDVTRAFNNASTAYALWRIIFSVTSGNAIDITLRIGLPQLEEGAFATSVIPTTTTALTRAADVASVNTLSPWFNASEGTFFVAATQAVIGTAGQLCAIEAGDGTNNNLIQLATQFGTTNFQGLVNVSNVAQAAFISAASTALTNRALAYKVNDFAQSINGGAVSTDTSGTVPTITGFGVGARVNGTSQLNGHLRRITYYPRRLSDAELQAITS